MKKRLLYFITFVTIFVAINVTYGSSIVQDNRLLKLDLFLQNISEYGNPDDEIIVAVLLETGTNNVSDEIDAATRNITNQIRNISENIKKKYREINSEYKEDELLKQFKENNQSFIEEYRRSMEKHGITRSFLNSQNKITEELRRERKRKTNEILTRKYSGIQENVTQKIEKLSDTSVIGNRVVTPSKIVFEVS